MSSKESTSTPSKAPTIDQVINRLLSILSEERTYDGFSPRNLPDRKTKSTAPSPLAQSTEMELDVTMEALMAEVETAKKEWKEVWDELPTSYDSGVKTFT